MHSYSLFFSSTLFLDLIIVMYILFMYMFDVRTYRPPSSLPPQDSQDCITTYLLSDNKRLWLCDSRNHHCGIIWHPPTPHDVIILC